jgi:hypothetical protein
MKRTSLFLSFASSLFLAACSGAPETTMAEAQDAFSSARAKLYDFTFEGQVLADATTSASVAVREQLFYTVGQLNGVKYERGSGGGVGRLDAVKIENVTTSADPSGKTLVRYKATLPVGWLDVYNAPQAFTFVLPKDVTVAGETAFAAKYGTTCIDTFATSRAGVSNLWYYYRPSARNCRLAEADVVRLSVAIAPSAEASSGTHPEYDKIWADGALNAVVIFGRDNAADNSFSDFGVSNYAQFSYKMKSQFALGVKMDPVSCVGRPSNSCAGMPAAPGAEFPDVTYEGKTTDGRTVRVTAMLIKAPTNTTTAWDARYAQLSSTADVIVYNGHAALGANVQALSRKGRFQKGQYTIVSMMSCDSFAYVDGYMAAERARLNADDPKGTKYLDMITNLMPTNPTKLPGAAFALLGGVMSPKAPRTYTQILGAFEADHFAVVTGDEDNAWKAVATR